MFDYDAATWTKHTAVDHAQDLLTDINTTLTSLGYTTSDLLKASSSNAIWIMLLAQGDARATYDELLYEAQNSLDPALCSDAQFLNLLTIAGTELTEGNYTTVDITVTADAVGSVVIPALSQLTFTDDIYFTTPDYEITIVAGDSLEITCTASERGAITVLANQLDAFDVTIENIDSITSDLSIEGSDDETVTEARKRVISGNTFDNTLDGLVTDLLALQGITGAKVYFNPDSTTPLVLPGGTSVAVRTLQVFVTGSSTLIGETIFKKLMVDTQGAETQTYTTLSGQSFPVSFDYATSTDIYVKIWIPTDADPSAATIVAMKEKVAAMSFGIGESVTSAKIDQEFTDYADVEIVDSEISDDEITYAQEIVVAEDNYASIVFANISVVNMA